MSLMDDYFAALLTEPRPEPEVKVAAKPLKPAAEIDKDERNKLDQLLAQVRAVQQPQEQEAPIAPPSALVPVQEDVAKVVDEQPTATSLEQQAEAAVAATTPTETVREGLFQVLLFDVAGLELAVPLDKLGGIHQISEVSPLFGKPDWFMGLMLHRQQKMRVVDTGRWVMPDKVSHQDLRENYRYLVMLGDSPWGLACDSLVRTERINSADVRWRQGGSKRPWLAGMVRERMCALLDVDALLGMLEQGLGGLEQEQ
ncbi:chemotaxis protein CheW [Gallaecimonas sp. GXIMD1310]|uniref:chemotaxis protein CheW n=1 Tax=Gallaecimonas sp. GXIMD1310 TaxID=3131926 RepID=UPI00325186BE